MFTAMDSSESRFSNLDVWCDWSGDPTDAVHVCMTVDVWCTPDSRITLLDASHPGVAEIVDSTLKPIVHFKGAEDAKLLPQNTESGSGTSTSTSTSPQQSPTLSDHVEVPITPEKQPEPMTPDNNTPRATLQPGYPNLNSNTHTPSDSGVQRAGHTPDGSPGDSLDAFYASFFRDVSSSEFLSEAGQSPSNPRKRNAKAASLPDSVTDSERSYGGEKLKNKSPVLAMCRDSPVSSTSSSSKHSRTRSLIPRPVSVTNHVRPDPANVPLPTDSVPVLDVEFRRFEDLSPVEKKSLENHVQVQNESVAEASSGDTSTPLASPTTRTSLDVSLGDTGKSLQDGQDVEKLSTVASAGSPCDTTLISDLVDSSFGGFPTQGTYRVQPPTPPRPSNRPRLSLVDQVFQIQCSPDFEPAWYKASVTLVLRLQPGRPRGWYELVVPGLPRLGSDDHGYVYLRIPDGQGLEYRTMHFRRYEIVENCLIAQFPVTQSKLVIPLRPCDVRFYGFLRDFKVNQIVRTRVTGDKRGSGMCTVEYTAVCSLELIQRDFWAEKCGFYIYIHGGPEGEFACHLETPKTKFQTIQLDSDPASEPGITQLQFICAPLNLDMFAITWEMRVPRGEVGSWTPRITALPDGYHIEEELQNRYLDAEEDEQEIVRGEPKSRLVSPKRVDKGSTFMSSVMKVLCWLLTLFLLLQPVAYSAGLYDGVLRGEASLEVRDILCEKFMLCGEKISVESFAGNHTEVTILVPEMTEMGEVVVPMETAEVDPSPVLEDFDVQAHEHVRSVRPIPTSLRDRVDYFLGWKGPLPIAGV
ncbi:uncharacterized protein N7496_005873 [Penicillium cataractarum]|uniref:Uncharacterized protein n=1 Tax=Penicillium cataractarum TaxID=2100454 RepID=A0A9W9S0I2_9EURO|nr:uncharacterized protein N7496_005873 [Penicillium cataractarum]KAJ5369781.1 hypothetical protein N7496_005873 [Penicillium cataractarum]